MFREIILRLWWYADAYIISVNILDLDIELCVCVDEWRSKFMISLYPLLKIMK